MRFGIDGQQHGERDNGNLPIPVTMTVKERKRVNRLKYLLIVLSVVELALLIACIRGAETDEYNSPVGDDYRYEDIWLNSNIHKEEPNAYTEREQVLRDAENRNSAMMGFGANPNEIIP